MILREQPIVVDIETYKQEKVVRQLLDLCELKYEWGEDDMVKIITTDPSQILFLKNRGVQVRYDSQDCNKSIYSDPLLE
ncbi:MAG: hypothetical protein IKU15_07995 [Clostridia bacterium]|nr:hypothetical protein [Clostridia bacterium]